MRKLQLKIQKAWLPPKGNESKRVVVKFVLHKDGTIADQTIHTSSGIDAADNGALKAIEKAAPFAPLPADANENTRMTITFDYNLYTSDLSDERVERQKAKTEKAINEAHVFLKQKDFEQTFEVLKEALQADPQDDKLWHELGKVYEVMGDSGNAGQCYAQASKINPYDYSSKP